MRPVFWHHSRAVGICRARLLPRMPGRELDLSGVAKTQANFPEDLQGTFHGRSPLSVPMGPRLWFGLLRSGRIGGGSDRVAIKGTSTEQDSRWWFILVRRWPFHHPGNFA